MPAETLAARIAESADKRILEEVRSPGVALAIWRRAPDPTLAKWLDALPLERLPGCRDICAANEAAALAEAACNEAGAPIGLERAALVADIGALASVFARLLGTSEVYLRLDIVRDDACRKFHQDHVTARLLCTYRGEGTEYGRAARGELPSEIGHLCAQEVGLFRGALWPGAGANAGTGGIVHRSPPGTKLARPRLLLVLDDAREH